MTSEIENDNENYKTCDYICFIIQIFIISGLIFFLYFLFTMIENMTFKMRYV